MRDEIQTYWQRVAGDVAAGNKELLVAVDDRGQVLGSAQLALESKANGRHRAEVQKVMVRHALRGRGIGAALMVRLEHEAQREGRSLLFLDTSTGASGATAFYRKLGYTFIGGIPNYAANPDGRLVANAIFYKLLPTTNTLRSANPFTSTSQQTVAT
ncbi:MAG TPA: GNAT family N-acetyltransferase [Candidatus Didemnitutus sp.]|nr:GNAT family N-acetyltransferase [Candidatus Didemnitutus sp.]